MRCRQRICNSSLNLGREEAIFIPPIDDACYSMQIGNVLSVLCPYSSGGSGFRGIPNSFVSSQSSVNQCKRRFSGTKINNKNTAFAAGIVSMANTIVPAVTFKFNYQSVHPWRGVLPTVPETRPRLDIVRQILLGQFRPRLVRLRHKVVRRQLLPC